MFAKVGVVLNSRKRVNMDLRICLGKKNKNEKKKKKKKKKQQHTRTHARTHTHNVSHVATVFEGGKLDLPCVTTRTVIKVRNVIKCYISHFYYIACRNVCDEKCNKI